MSEPAITVVVAAHNEATLLPHCLASLKAQQTSRAVELLVVDNASQDATAAIATAEGRASSAAKRSARSTPSRPACAPHRRRWSQ